ncbi:MAG TPA: Crp/Fnr family transcriptional regulator [Puia sp.]|jgi:CRP-like cAMP-binding protein|nr:Crp/Fnr family transcriptional regulator [Puia sp.]
MIRKNLTILRIIDELAGSGQTGHGILVRNFHKGHLLIGQGTTTTNVFFIRSGIVKCTFSENNDKEYILEFLGEGQVLGELEAITQAPAMSSVRAISDLAAYMLDGSSFLDLLRRNEDFNRAMMELMAVRLTDTAQRSARQQLNPLEHNLTQLLAALEYEKLPCTKQELADYLGITLRSLNRMLKDRPAHSHKWFSN